MHRTLATRMRAVRRMTPACAIAALRSRPPVPLTARRRSTRRSANATDQYLPKHFPFPWFESILKSGDCNSRHIASLFDRTNGLYRDLQRKSTTPAFSWITPNMCSDGHDAVCYGNNLSGGFSNPTTPRAPKNYTGGLYSADLFLKHVVPEIEKSPAFKDGGLIDITFDEGYPPFTYTGDSFANSKLVAPNAATSIADASAAETLFGRRVHFEPTGPNTPLAKDAHGNELYPGPGFNSYIDRPSNCVPQQLPRLPAGTCILGGGHTSQVHAQTPQQRPRPGARRLPTTRRSRPTRDARSPALGSRRARSSARSPTRRSTRPLRTGAAASRTSARSRSWTPPAAFCGRPPRSAESCSERGPRPATRCMTRRTRRPAVETPAAC